MAMLEQRLEDLERELLETGAANPQRADFLEQRARAEDASEAGVLALLLPAFLQATLDAAVDLLAVHELGVQERGRGEQQERELLALVVPLHQRFEVPSGLGHATKFHDAPARVFLGAPDQRAPD